MKRKLLSGALALVMLAGCTAPVPDTQKLPDDGGEDVFVHYAEIKDDGSTNKFKMLYEGDRVEYTPASSGKGTQAKDVVKLSSGEARSE